MFYILRNCPRLIGFRLFSLQLNSSERIPHQPVMANEVVQYLEPKDNSIIIDMTFGAGGHSKLLLNANPNIKLFGLDRDPAALDYAKDFQNFPNFTMLMGKFSDLPQLLSNHGIERGSVDGMLFDFGCSSMQFDRAERGFSISNNGPLDMRMDNSTSNKHLTAAVVLNCIKEEDLAKILKMYGEERHSKKIARAIVEARQIVPFKTTNDVSKVVATVLESDHRQNKLKGHAHSATKTFQAIRIFVNNEVNEINYGMVLAYHYLKIGGRLVTLTFHSLEDKIVKRHLMGNITDNAINLCPKKYMEYRVWREFDETTQLQSGWKQINKHVQIPSDDEVNENPRSRSAKLRAAIKIK